MKKIPILEVIVGKGQIKMKQEKIKGSKGMENTNKSKGHREFSRIR